MPSSAEPSLAACSAVERPTWSRPGEAVALFCKGATVRTAWKVALVVGAVLSAANQSGVLLAGEANWATWVRIAFNFCVPFVVASVGFLSACREGRSA